MGAGKVVGEGASFSVRVRHTCSVGEAGKKIKVMKGQSRTLIANGDGSFTLSEGEIVTKISAGQAESVFDFA